MLKQIGIDDKDYRIIHNLYFQQKAALNLLKIFLTGLTLKEVFDRAV